MEILLDRVVSRLIQTFVFGFSLNTRENRKIILIKQEYTTAMYKGSNTQFSHATKIPMKFLIQNVVIRTSRGMRDIPVTWERMFFQA